MYENHVPAKWRDQVPEGRPQRRRASTSGCSRARATSTPFGMAATVGWPREEWGFNPGCVLRAAARLLRRARAGARHERQRRAGVDELPDDGRASTPARSPRRDDKELALVMLQAYNDWDIDEWCARLPGPVHPARHRPDVGRRPRRRGGPPHRARRAAGRSASSRRRTCRASRASCPATGTRCSQAHRATRTWCCRCTSAPGSTSSSGRRRRRSTT